MVYESTQAKAELYMNMEPQRNYDVQSKKVFMQGSLNNHVNEKK